MRILPTLAFACLFISIINCKSLDDSKQSQVSASIDPIVTTPYFEFYNNYWINLHHFFYKMSKEAEKSSFEEVFEGDFLAKLQPDQLEDLKEGIRYYQENLIDKNLLFNNQMYNLKRWLIQFPEQSNLPNGAFNEELINTLNKLKPIYTSHFWSAHSQQNQAIIKEKLKWIKKFEHPFFSSMTKLSKNNLPEGKIRIDLSYHSNWAGAYTSIQGGVHAVVASNQGKLKGDWVEIIFHEPTHALIDVEQGAVAAAIAKVSQQLEVRPPQRLWHAILFYLSGRIVQDLFNREGVEYQLMMFRKGIFESFHPYLNQLDPYYDGKINLESAIKTLIESMYKGSLDDSNQEETQYFRFHNNFWINLHHFFYKMAKEAKKSSFEEVFANEFIAALNPNQLKDLKDGVKYYQDSLIKRDLLFNGLMYNLKKWLIQFSGESDLAKGAFDVQLISTLNSLKPIYAQHFWSKHQKRNQFVLEDNLSLIKKFETEFFTSMTKYSQTNLPEGKIRIDLTYYANWAGAYTTTRPNVHAVVSTINNELEGDWVETIFHEPSHALVSSRRGIVSETINKVCEQLNVKPPRQLWHAFLFYISGRIIQDLLAKEGINYQLYMFRGKVFDAYHNSLKELDPFYAGETDLETAIKALIKSIYQR